MTTWFYNFIDLLFNALTIAILARALLSWFGIGPENPLVRLLYEVTEPILAPLRRVIPPLGMIDITPIVALFLLMFLHRLILASLTGF
ncbi:MAG: YggT family protein [Chloroflexi bacterium]|nr:YggT family protein [Chloroflexota bacterium]MCL5075635.1 YggT family protein [Chloroflexota bacterium]